MIWSIINVQQGALFIIIYSLIHRPLKWIVIILNSPTSYLNSISNFIIINIFSIWLYNSFSLTNK